MWWVWCGCKNGCLVGVVVLNVWCGVCVVLFGFVILCVYYYLVMLLFVWCYIGLC